MPERGNDLDPPPASPTMHIPHAHATASPSRSSAPDARKRLRQVLVLGLIGALLLLVAYVHVLRGAVREGRELRAEQSVHESPGARCMRLEDRGERRDCLAEAARLAPPGGSTLGDTVTR